MVGLDSREDEHGLCYTAYLSFRRFRDSTSIFLLSRVIKSCGSDPRQRALHCAAMDPFVMSDDGSTHDLRPQGMIDGGLWA